MNVQQERACFETAARVEGLDLERLEDGYRSPRTNIAWVMWLTRAALPATSADERPPCE